MKTRTASSGHLSAMSRAPCQSMSNRTSRPSDRARSIGARGRAVAGAVDVGPFQEGVSVDQALELGVVDEVIVAVGDLAGRMPRVVMEIESSSPP
jgi:hypothetical protein